jgi:sugar transferase (PEP-CTERM/EpsH1 system associated)
MSEIPFLSHRIPFPPDKGDKIRSYHVLRELARRHTVHLGTFVDDPRDWDYVDQLKQMCGETFLQPFNPSAAKLAGLSGFVTGDPLTLACYRHRGLRAWVRDLAGRKSLAGVYVFSSAMAQYARDLNLPPGSVRVIDLCDVDSDKWAQYARSHSFPLSWVYAREARLLAACEAKYVSGFDASLVISAAEAAILGRVAGAGNGRISVVPNGVDTSYFEPQGQFENPFPAGARPIVFTGAMDYHANVDGVCWFARTLLPGIRRLVPDALFAVVGSNPGRDVKALQADGGVLVTGRVADVRPYLAYAAVVVAPLRIARGVQNKVLEAMAMARTVVATANAVQGIPEAEVAGVKVAAEGGEFADAVVAVLNGTVDASAAREFVIRRFGWSQHLQEVIRLFDPPRNSHHRGGTTQPAVA